MTPTQRSSRALLAASLALSVVVLAVAARWLGQNELPDGYQNEFIHLFTLGEIWFRIRDAGLGEAWPFLWDEYYPPGMHLPAALGMAIAGRSRAVAVLSQGLWLLPLLLATGALGRRLSGEPWAASWALVLVAFAPAVFGNVRRYEPNVAVAALVALALWWLARGAMAGPGRRGELRDAAIFGALCAAGLLVDRLVFGVYLAAPAVLLALRHRRWRAWGVAAGVVLLGAGYFYARFLVLHSGEITSQLGGEIQADGEESGALPPWTLKGLLYYPLTWVDGGLGLLPALFVVLGLGAWVVRGRRGAPAGPRAVLESALLVGYALFTLIGKKQPYYAIPLLAPTVVLAAAGWVAVLPRRAAARAAVLAALTLVGLNQLAFLSTGAALLPIPARAAALSGASPLPDRFLGHEYVMAGPPFVQGLHLDEVARLCRGDADDPGVTLLLSEGQAAYEGQVMPTLRLLLDTRAVPGMLLEPEAWRESAPLARCFVYVARDPSRSWPTEESIAELFSQWSYDPAGPELLAALDGVRARSRRLGRWETEPGEAVHVFALVPR